MQDIVDPYFLAAYGVGSLACFLLLFLFFKLAFKNSITESGIKGLGSSLPNSIFIGYPLLLQVLDQPPIGAFAMASLVENIMIFPLALIVMDIGASVNSQKSFTDMLKEIVTQLAKNPILIAIIAGSLASTTGFQLPEFADKIVTMMAKASAAASLFFVGGLLVGTTIKCITRSIAAISIGKLIIHPMLVAICVLKLPDFDPLLQMTAVLLATSPMLAIFPIIGTKYGHGQISASIILETTIASLVTISAIFLFISNSNMGL